MAEASAAGGLAGGAIYDAILGHCALKARAEAVLHVELQGFPAPGPGDREPREETRPSLDESDRTTAPRGVRAEGSELDEAVLDGEVGQLGVRVQAERLHQLVLVELDRPGRDSEAAAISFAERPSARSWRTSRCRGVRAATGSAAFSGACFMAPSTSPASWGVR